MTDKAPDAYRTISEVAEDLDLPQHVLRFWETRFNQIRPLKRGGGRRYYRPDDVELLKGIRHLLYKEGYTIKGVQRILKEHGVRAVQGIVKAPPADWRPDPADFEPEPPARPPVPPPPAFGAEAVPESMAPRLEWPDPAAAATVLPVTAPPPPEAPRGQVSMFRGGLQRGETGFGAGSTLEFAGRLRAAAPESGAAGGKDEEEMAGPRIGAGDPPCRPVQDDLLRAALEELVAARAMIDQILQRRPG
ncbi:MerR family transcriptional regulator [Rhabdaerophilum calidifontis]|uniref:MerR family transcriptional regulator n=1 Tax=Rhabdaerophilum calidifontis TaxID=2604328 RepID=UPI001238A5EC|nr:MerR family transcriptional regulator [Rhabdaerophilum calidifontis]